MKKVVLGLLAAVAGLAIAPDPVLAQGFPGRPVTIIAPYPPSSGPDLFARLLAPKMGEALGQPVLVENRPGAAGVVAVQHMLNLPADGYTVMVGDTSNMILAPYLVKDLPYKPLEVMRPIGLMGTQGYILATSVAANDFQTTRDLIDAAKAKPGGISYGSPGFGSNHHIIMETFARKAGIQLKAVHYNGGAQLNAALLAGEVDIGLSSIGSLKPNLDAKAVRLLATSTAESLALLPGVPPISDIIPEFAFASDPGLVTPAGVPDEVVEKISAALKAALDDPGVQKGFRNLSFEPIYGDAAAYQENLDMNAKKFAEAVEIAGVTPK